MNSKRWQYKVVDLRDNDLLPGITECHPSYRALGNVDAANLNAMGGEGWELVTIHNHCAYFKRQIFQEALTANTPIEALYG